MGCILLLASTLGAPATQADPNLRMRLSFRHTETFGAISADWPRYSFTNSPSHLTPVAVYGGVGP